jgi:hypothetical protein
MTNDELLIECKKGLNISLDSTAFDGILTQKLAAVKAFVTNAGVSAVKMDTNPELTIGVIVMGVADLWELQGGAIKFSPAFNTLLSQLTYADETVV